MKIATWNVNGIRAVWKKGDLQEFIKKEKPDILGIQETKAEVEQLEDDTKDHEGYYTFFESSKMRKGYSGVAIFSRVHPEKVDGTMGYEDFLDNEGRTLVAEYKDFYLINCYFPNGGKSEEHFKYKLEYYERFLKLAKKLEKKKPVVFMGDVNTAQEEIDLARPKENEKHVGFTMVEREYVRKFSEHFLDIWRVKNPEKVQYSWWDQKSGARARNVGWRIDYIFISKSLEKKVKNVEILDKQMGSDHCPVVLEIDL
jgi:exodeoxyribonuclease III